ncbi:MAG: mannose-1-phosphate guanylyltransferase/mannose-6-phosphate isomerase, partial [Candidatus Dormibacteraeota bacterium]|nr:mannose-1-phosphate guanylyltransferase/mannose-6-phosphate isomerase [Candidatus Dormibacteraeota bacterium]
TVVQASFTWSDLGSWSDLHLARAESGEADAEGNVTSGDVVLVDAQGCTVEARGGRLVAVAGAQDLVVVDTPDAVLVVPASQSQLVKQVVDRLRAGGRTEVL